MPSLPARRNDTAGVALPKRLSVIADRIPEEGTVCDVGSDHALLPLYLLKKDEDRRVVVTDIKPMPLSRAKVALMEANVAERALFFLADGIPSEACDFISSYVIAGMSGETIAGILKAGETRIRLGQSFFLQPMSHEDVLRCFLYRSGYAIEEEVLVRENGRYFLIIVAVYAGRRAVRSPDPLQDAVGEYLPTHPVTWRKAYFQQKRAALINVISKRRAAGVDSPAEENLLCRINEILEELS